MKNIDIAVIGAGLTGLTTAHHLRKKGKEFIVIEKASKAGGVIHTHEKDGFVFEQGPNSGVIGQPEVADLFDDLKDLCTLEVANEAVKKRYILKNGEWVAMPSGVWSAVTTPLFSLKDKFRILGEPFRRPGKNPNESLAQLVKRRMGDSFLDYAIDPFILGVYAGDPDYLVPKYAFPKLYNLEQDYGSFIGGTIKKQFEKKDPQAQKATREVFSAKGGLSKLVEALVKSVGSEHIVLNAGEVQISPVDGKYSVSYSENGQRVELLANKVITTTGAHELPSLLPFADNDLLQKITNLKYAKVIEAVIGFKNWDGMPLDGFGGLIPFKEERDILGVLFLSSLFSGRAPQGGALLTVFLGGIRRAEINGLTDEEVIQVLELEVSDLMKLSDFKPDLLHLTRYSQAIPQYGTDSSARFEAVEQLQKMHRGLIIAGNLRDGIGMADRIKQGTRIAEEVSAL